MPEPVRIKDIPENDLTPEQAKVFKDLVAGRGRLLTPYRIWIHSPRLAAALETIGTFLNKKGSLSEREVELLICIIANHWKGEYVWTVHTRAAVKLGIPQSVFDAIRAGQEPVLDNERERAIFDLARSAMEAGAGPDEVFTRAERLLGRNGIAELLALLGYYSSVAMAVKLHRVPVPA
jgi:4-carboxymuconolactone decarboxylase